MEAVRCVERRPLQEIAFLTSGSSRKIGLRKSGRPRLPLRINEGVGVAGGRGGVRTAQRFRHRARAELGAAMTRLSVDVTFDERFGYTGTAPELRSAVRALSLNGLRRLVEDQFPGQALDLRLVLDRKAKLERDARRNGGASRAGDHAARAR